MITVCVDTNVVLRMRGQAGEFRPLLSALAAGKLRWAVSTDILLEYEEVLIAKCGESRWQSFWSLIQAIALRHETIDTLDPQFRFRVITTDPDDNKFADCAIAANADFVITEDAHFAPLVTAGYKAQPIAPADFIERFLK